MTPKETARSYDQIADHWDSDQFNRENGLSQHKRALQFLKERGSAIDIGCGSSGRIIDLLLEEGFEVEGLDISAEMLRLARMRRPNLTYHQADICEWSFEHRYNFISAWDSIWHVPLRDQASVLEKLCHALDDGGVLIFTSGGLDTPGDVTNPFLSQPLYHAALGIPKLLEILSENQCVCRHLEYDQFPEPHIYLIAQRTLRSQP